MSIKRNTQIGRVRLADSTTVRELHGNSVVAECRAWHAVLGDEEGDRRYAGRTQMHLGSLKTIGPVSRTIRVLKQQ